MDDEDEVRSIEEGIFASEAEESGGEEGKRNEDEDKKSGDEDEKDKDKKKVKPKRTGPVKRQMIHEEMLIGPNGLIKLDDAFKDFKLGGKGHESEDVDRILHKLEHWVHNLHPRYPFAQTLERMEFLGMRKKVIKTHLKKIRMGLVTSVRADENNLPDFPDSDVEMESSHQPTEIYPSTSMDIQVDDDDDDDEFMNLMNQVPQTNGSETNAAKKGDEFPDDDFDPADIDPADLEVNPTKKDHDVSEDEEMFEELHNKLSNADASSDEEDISTDFRDKTTILIPPTGGTGEISLERTEVCTLPSQNVEEADLESSVPVETNDVESESPTKP